MTQPSTFPAWRASYATPFGERWLTVRAPDHAKAKMMALLKLNKGLFKAGWSFNKVEPVIRKEQLK